MASRRWAANLDMYRKVPVDLLEGTKRGSFMSYFALFIMFALFLAETRSFLSGPILVTDLSLDGSKEKKIRVNFNITMMDMSCDYATVDLVSSLGTEQNVTQHVTKYKLDAEGVRKGYHGRNKNQKDIITSDTLVTETLDELHTNGEDAMSLDATTFEFALEEYSFLFVDFYASWCSHCKALSPTWEALAEVMRIVAEDTVISESLEEGTQLTREQLEEAHKVRLPVMVAKVDCVMHEQLCRDQKISGYPTLRLFADGKFKADYLADREVIEMTHWLASVETELYGNVGIMELVHNVANEYMGTNETLTSMKEIPKTPQRHDPAGKSKEQVEWSEKMSKHRRRTEQLNRKDEDHPGCNLSGFLWVDRAPGNFHIQARSNSHDIAAHMTNVSHEVHHLSFGNPGIKYQVEKGLVTYPPNFLETMNPMDGNVYVNPNEHEAFHHYLKIVTTEFDDPFTNTKKNNLQAYQLQSNSQLSFYRTDIIPEAKFSYDPSPISVYYRKKVKKRWYDYITSLMAIIGGTFTLVGMLEHSVHAMTSKKRR
eukprot:CAMPEP_0197825118 /NCGR_PEP_ID=MMETSP1437-20131217/2251_1 /TAXON_ID=49252 ORGANISM="Eucampia antarctica, Strain CCMP1452" /NCGR_SAMPLE_ID=MMETSP1437 /ASSEMBLY_ACC=CAM_ASM_001096 /LENGTH=539 /DNA_ID=CAMNT_0043424989 /DNA_START=91 /DNA_END=1710 /DNA_ORIENTATION=+